MERINHDLKNADDKTFENQYQWAFGVIKTFEGVHHNQYSYFIYFIRAQSINGINSDLNYGHQFITIQNGPHIKRPWTELNW